MALLVGLLTSGPAAAVTIGALDPHPNGNPMGGPPWSDDGYSNTGCPYVGTIYVPADDDRGLSGHPGWMVPAGGGVLTSWATSGQGQDGRFRLVVVRYSSDHTVSIRASGPVETITPAQSFGTARFPVRLAVSAGDVVALDAVDLGWQPNDCYYPATESNYINFADDSPDDPARADFGSPLVRHRRVNVEATLQRPGEEGVPPAAPGQGTSARCRVPALKRLTLRRARIRLKRAGCALGRIKSRRHRTRRNTRRVVAQRPGPGNVRAPHARVDVRVR